MRLEHHLVGGYVRYISPYIIIIIIQSSKVGFRKFFFSFECLFKSENTSEKKLF